MKNTKIKLILAVLGGFAYIMLLLYISSIQSNYDVQISTKQEAYVFSADAAGDYILNVEIKNQANRVLSSAEDQNIFLSYHLYDSKNNLIRFDNIRSPLEHNIYSGDRSEVKLHISSLEKGEYFVGIDIVQESVIWFSEKENVEKMIKIIVE